MKEITKEWIKIAEEDYIIATKAKKFKPTPNYAISFHAQQCIEKYLKGLLQENDIEFEKIHDLDVLYYQCKDILPEIGNYIEDLITLSIYAVDVRYPGLDISVEESQECVNIMEKIRKIIRNYFQL